MPRITISYSNPNSFECDMKVEKGMEGQVGSIFAVVANKLTTCSDLELWAMQYGSILESQIIIEVEGTNVSIKWNNLSNPINQLKAIGEFLKVQAFKMWAMPSPQKIITLGNKFGLQ